MAGQAKFTCIKKGECREAKSHLHLCGGLNKRSNRKMFKIREAENTRLKRKKTVRQ